MNDHEKSYSSIRPEKSPNKPVEARERVEGAEVMEERELAKGNPSEHNTHRTQSRESVSSGLERVREVARTDKELRFTALMHHIYDVDRLREAYKGLNKDASAGVDGVTWRAYGEELETNIQGLADRLKRGAYRASPARRATISKQNGGERHLGVPTLEDKIVQRATVEVLNGIYEQDFLGFSYGFRPGRGQHDALDALAVGLHDKKVRWVLDADIRGFFDTLDHGWLVKFIEHRIGDRRVVRLIQKWLKAGVLADGEHIVGTVGTVQGGSISPLLANIYLHYVLDLWVHQWRRKQGRGDVIIVRYADDFVVGFYHRADAERFEAELRQRLAEFGLELHPEKTRLIEFGRFAGTNRARRGEGKGESFVFLGLRHIYGRSRQGYATLLRRTSRESFRAGLSKVKATLRHHSWWSIPQMGEYLAAALEGHAAYFGVPTNSQRLWAFRYAVAWLWKQALERRSQRTRVKWTRMQRLIARWLPPAEIKHPYPSARFAVNTRGRNRMR
jgi:group II intron reverse transcriptase/maturase